MGEDSGKRKIERRKQQIIDAEIVESHWDVKKIAIGLGVLVVLGAGTAYGKYLYDQYSKPQHLLSVQGVDTAVSTDNETPVVSVTPSASHFALPSTSDVGTAVQNKIQDIQDQVSQINVQELATTSPQIQAVIQQIQQLKLHT